MRMTSLPKAQPRRLSRAFSLVEVAIALGIVSFSMLALVGSLPIGLRSMKDSRVEIAQANISRQLRGELQQIPFSASSNSPFAIGNLATAEYYFTQDGMRTSASADPHNAPYYKATFRVTNAAVPGSDNLSFASSNAQRVEVSLSYPYGAAAFTNTFSIFAAKQKNP